jgi:hypothetical protein
MKRTSVYGSIFTSLVEDQMKCSDCPAFELLNEDPNNEFSNPVWDQEYLKRFGKLGVCHLYNSPQRERDIMSCDDSGELDQFILIRQKQIKLAEKVIHHVRCRSKTK